MFNEHNVFDGGNLLGDVEIDLVARKKGLEKHLVAECKWTDLTKAQREGRLDDLQKKFARTKLAKKLRNVEFRIFSKGDLKTVARR